MVRSKDYKVRGKDSDKVGLIMNDLTPLHQRNVYKNDPSFEKDHQESFLF